MPTLPDRPDGSRIWESTNEALTDLIISRKSPRITNYAYLNPKRHEYKEEKTLNHKDLSAKLPFLFQNRFEHT